MKNTEICSDVTVVIRSAGERTEALCKKLVFKQVPSENVVCIHETPFIKALAKSFEVGIERGLPWTLCLDADYLLMKGAILRLVDTFKRCGDNVFKLQGETMDKFFGGPVLAGGHHLYRTALLPVAQEFLPFGSETGRPESAVLVKMTQIGHPLHQLSEVSGMHDYQQYYRDIYRKMCVRAHKFRSYLMYFLKRFQQLAPQDDDYKVALLGLIDGLAQEEAPKLDVTEFPPDEIESRLRVWGLCEKEPLNESVHEDDVERIIKNFVPSKEFLEMKKRMQAKVAYAPEKKSFWSCLWRIKSGWLRDAL